MKDRIGESLSALMDDQANELELERILSRVKRDAEVRRTWMRYNLAQQALHGHHMAHLDRDISTQVQAALADSSSNDPGTLAMFKQRMVRPLISLAVAASVTVTVVIGGQRLAESGSVGAHALDHSVASSASPVGMLNSLGATPVRASYGMQAVPVLQPATRTAYEELAQQRLRKYAQEHAEQAALNSPQGLVPFARVPQIRE